MDSFKRRLNRLFKKRNVRETPKADVIPTPSAPSSTVVLPSIPEENIPEEKIPEEKIPEERNSEERNNEERNDVFV